jgi:hypothetical protein
VLVEVISALVRVKVIHERFPGGWKAFVSKVPIRTLCWDNELARVGFMTPDDCKKFVDHVESIGIIFKQDGHARDIVVADQMRGFTVPCDWAEFGQIELQPGQTVSAVRTKGGTEPQLFCLEDWKYEDSLSCHFGFVPSGQEQKSLRFMRSEPGVDVYYLNTLTGKEVYVGSTGASKCDTR